MRGSVQTKWRAIVGRRLPQSYQYTQYGHSEMGLVLANLQTTVLNGLWRAEHSHITWKREGTIENVHLLWPENRCLHLDLYYLFKLTDNKCSSIVLYTNHARPAFHSTKGILRIFFLNCAVAQIRLSKDNLHRILVYFNGENFRF